MADQDQEQKKRDPKSREKTKPDGKEGGGGGGDDKNAREASRRRKRLLKRIAKSEKKRGNLQVRMSKHIGKKGE